MRFPLYLVIVSLPLVTWPRFGGSVKVADFAFVFLIACEALGGRLRISVLAAALVTLFCAFAVYGFLRINYYEPITVLGGWDYGFVSPQVYQAITAAQTSVYVVGAAILGRYFFQPGSGILKFQVWYFIAISVWSVIGVVRYLGIAGLADPRFGMSGTFTEKGPMAMYVAFLYALVVTTMDMPGMPRLSLLEKLLFFGAVLVDLSLCRADRGTLMFLIFTAGYFLSRTPKAASRVMPLLALVLILLIPLYSRGLDKIDIYLRAAQRLDATAQNGRYAGVILAPSLIRSAPLFGVGYGNYIFYRTSNQYAWFLPVMPKDEPDNALLLVAMECGLVGAALFVLLVAVWPGYLLARLGRRGLWPYYVAYLVSLTSGITSYFLIWVWLFTLLAMIRVCNRAGSGERGAAAAALPAAGPRWYLPRPPYALPQPQAAAGALPAASAGTGTSTN